MALALTLAGTVVIKIYREKKLFSKREQQQKLERISKAVNSVTRCDFSVCLIRYRDFKALKRLVPFEKALHDGKLITLHTYRDVLAFVSVYDTCFFSHQWLGWHEPDANGVHFAAICAAAQALCRDSKIQPEELFLWIDVRALSCSLAHICWLKEH
eukprot:3791793-Prymnesium_polylepis.1